MTGRVMSRMDEEGTAYHSFIPSLRHSYKSTSGCSLNFPLAKEIGHDEVSFHKRTSSKSQEEIDL